MKLLKTLWGVPLAISSCGLTPTITVPKDTTIPEGEIAIKKEYDYSDSIGDAWTKDYSNDDMKVINNLWKSTLTIAAISDSLQISGNETIDTMCNKLANGQTTIGDITKPLSDRKYDYKDKSADPLLNTKDSGDYTIKQGGEEQYLNTGTGWVIAQNTSHFFIATNHHVAMKVTKRTNEVPGFANGEGTIDPCITVASTEEGRLKAAVIDKSLGDNGLIYNGRGATGKSYNWTDMAIVALKKSDIGLEMPTVKLSTKVTKGASDTITKNRLSNMLSESILYTAGYPSGAKRPNKTNPPKALRSNFDGYDVGAGQDTDGTELQSSWTNPYAEYNFFTDGGSSGSAVVNADGELEFLNTLKIAEPSRMENNDYWTQFRSSGVPAFWIKDIVDNELCTTNTYNLDICE